MKRTPYVFPSPTLEKEKGWVGGEKILLRGHLLWPTPASTYQVLGSPLGEHSPTLIAHSRFLCLFFNGMTQKRSLS